MNLNSINFNSLPASVFDETAILDSTSGDGGNDGLRATLVSGGRVIMSDFGGNCFNSMRKSNDLSPAYEPHLNSQEYAEFAEHYRQKLLLYCCKVSSNFTGEPVPANYAAFLSRQRQYMGDPAFLRVLSGIMRDVISPVLPATMSNALALLANVVTTAPGQSYEVTVNSNAVFQFEDDSWGASMSKPDNHAYPLPVSLKPRLKSANASIKWYQFIANGQDVGQIFNSMAAGLNSKVLAMFNGAMSKAVADTSIVPAALKMSYSTSNLVTLANKVSALNRVPIGSLLGMGGYVPLSRMLPAQVTGAANVNMDAAIATLLGQEYVRNGFIGENMGVRMLPLQDAIVPNTQNSTINTVLPQNEAYITAPMGGGYKPIWIAFESGAPVMIEIAPDKTADMTLNVNVRVPMAAAPVVGSKFGVLTAV
ncbi:MAG: hypothetical protein RR235_05010 [Oscillospiraceae bacterium]